MTQKKIKTQIHYQKLIQHREKIIVAAAEGADDVNPWVHQRMTH